MHSDTIILDLVFLLKNPGLCTKRNLENFFPQKIRPHLSHLTVVMAHRIILGKITCESSNWQHIERLKITILGANWQLFRLERMAKYSYFTLSKQNIKLY